MKKFLIVLFTVCLAAAFLAGCGSPTTDTGNDTTPEPVDEGPKFAGEKIVVSVWGGT